jgi:putative transport protein
LVSRSIKVDGTAEPSVGELERRYRQRIRFSRLQQGRSADDVQAPGDEARLRPGDIVTVVGPIDLVDQVTRELGHPSTESLEADRGAVDFRRITLSDEDLAGHTIEDLDLMRRFGAKVIRVRRGDVDVLAKDSFVLQPGDRLRIIAPRDQISAVTAFLGDSERGLSDIHPIVLGTGMVLGLMLGSVVFPLPGMALSIGPAAGTLLVGLIFGKVGRIGPFLTTMPHTAGQTIAVRVLASCTAGAAGTQLGTALASMESGSCYWAWPSPPASPSACSSSCGASLGWVAPACPASWRPRTRSPRCSRSPTTAPGMTAASRTATRWFIRQH